MKNRASPIHSEICKRESVRREPLSPGSVRSQLSRALAGPSMQPSLFLLIFVYAVAIATGTLFAAVGLYATAPAWLAPICSGDAWLCQYPFLPLMAQLPLLFLYRRIQMRELPDSSPWARRLRQILD